MAKSAVCLISECGKPEANKRGWCSAHYQRWLRHGDPLAGGTMHGEPLRYFREVVMAYEGDECLEWPYAKSDNGYGQISRRSGCSHMQNVSRAVCEIVHGPPPTPEHQAAHSCGRGHLACVTKGHLSWKTRPENEADKLAHGTHNRGGRNGQAKITEEGAREIFVLRDRMSQTAIAAQFGISRSCVSGIHCRKIWGGVALDSPQREGGADFNGVVRPESA